MRHPNRDVIPELRAMLIARAFLFEDPAAYQAGVDETLAAVVLHVRPRQSDPRPTPLAPVAAA